MSGTRSEQCWAAQRHLPDVCPMRRTCEAVGLERDALRVANDGKDAEIARLRERAERYDAEIETLRGIVYSLSMRVADQSELLTKRAERTRADDLRDGDGDG